MGAKNPFTIVTSFFDIGRERWEYYACPRERYLYWFRNLLSVDVPLYIVVDEELLEFVREHRRPFDPDGSRTCVRPVAFPSTPAYVRYHDRLATLMAAPAFKRKIQFNVPEMLYPQYNVLMFNKSFLLERACAENPFGSVYFGWVDAGALREEAGRYRGRAWPGAGRGFPRDRVRVFSHHAELRLADLEEHVLSQMRYIQGGSFFVGDESASALREMTERWIAFCLDRGFIGSDEKVLDLCWYGSPERFDVVRCDWREFFDRMA